MLCILFKECECLSSLYHTGSLGPSCWWLDLTFALVRWLEMMKTVTQNSVEVAKTSELRGLLDEYGSSDADVLHLEGEIHSGTKPVSCSNHITYFLINSDTHL